MKFRLPDTLIIVSGVLILVGILTWIVPAGEFAKEVVNNKEQIVPGSFKYTDANPQGITDLLLAPVKGMSSVAQIIAFVLLVGGAFQLFTLSGALQTALERMVVVCHKYPQLKYGTIALLIVLFSLAGASFGMSEEVLVFVLITLPLADSLGYNKIVGLAIPFVGAGVGFAGAFSNPFTIGIAQSIAGLTPFSGMEYRLLVWAVLTTITTIYILLYIRKLDKQKTETLEGNATSLEVKSSALSLSQIFILFSFLVLLVLLVYGVKEYGWYIEEIAALFLAFGVVCAIVSRTEMNTAAEAFKKGAQEMLPAALIIGLSKGILILATDGKIIDTILYSMSTGLDGIGKIASIELMFLSQSFLNFFLPSGSGQAALTMPIMAPLSDLLGVSRQTAVLAFQFGDGLSNMIIPTSGVTMGVLGISKISYGEWLKWFYPLFIILTLTAMALLIPPSIFLQF
ncbi:putative ion transporter superfamily protein YfcC [Sediminitomix flava]|uniref:Putative ion transporter superfamily protein YfcC n=2 Tax=Sediminitomix flava TaxID=379075 RepID=A0A315ZEZ2_SEDFL|nr:putative ion transporter superfamily protein YfcC [Sediminitomix flava]